MTHRWRWRRMRAWPGGPWVPHIFAGRVGQPCRVLAAGRGSVAVEFPDGTRAVVSRWAVRRA